MTELRWVNCDSPSPAYFGGWAADMGLYTGPWPMMPPPKVIGGVPGNSDEVDFVLGFPNPAHPGDPYYALDDSYSSPIWSNWRFLRSFGPPSQVGYHRSYSGDIDVRPSSTAKPPAGVHLWVVAYFRADGPPVAPPAAYVPRTYARAGAAEFETVSGALAPWQPGFPESGTAALGTGFQPGHSSERFGTDDSTTGSGAFGSTHDLVQEQLAVVSATSWTYGPPAFFSDIVYSDSLAEYICSAWQFFDIFEHRDALFVAKPSVVEYRATTTLQPVPLNYNDQGIAWSPIPWGDNDYEYESANAFDFAWDDLQASTSTGFFTLEGTALAFIPYTATIRFSRLDAWPLGVVTGPITSGTTLLDVDTNETNTAPSPHLIPLNGITAQTLVISSATTFWLEGEIGALAPNLPSPIAHGEGSARFSYDYSFAPLTYRWTTARWRYQLPDQIVAIGRATGTGVPKPRAVDFW